MDSGIDDVPAIDDISKPHTCFQDLEHGAALRCARANKTTGPQAHGHATTEYLDGDDKPPVTVYVGWLLASGSTY